MLLWFRGRTLTLQQQSGRLNASAPGLLKYPQGLRYRLSAEATPQPLLPMAL
jgi:hypothetical protein